MVDAEKGGSGGPERDVPVDWEALEDAFENNAPEVHSYLHLATGEVLRVVDGIADPEMHTRIASDSAYVRIEPVSSREQYRWMERFIPMVDEPELKNRLTAAIDGKGAFRRFKDVLMSFGAERERWFAFRSERLRVFMEAWLSAHALRPVRRATWPAETPQRLKDQLPISQEQLSGRRSRGADALRKQVRDVVDSLGMRDLEKVLAFAEFIKARRAAKSYAHRHEPPPPEGGGEEPARPAATPAPAPRSSDAEPNSPSRKRTASR
jgi:transposase-like protein